MSIRNVLGDNQTPTYCRTPQKHFIKCQTCHPKCNANGQGKVNFSILTQLKTIGAPGPTRKFIQIVEKKYITRFTTQQQKTHTELKLTFIPISRSCHG